MSDHDFGGGDWWELQPPPPGEEDDSEGSYLSEEGEGDSPSPPPEPAERVDYGELELSFGLEEIIINIAEFIMTPENINPSEIRGIGFYDPGEALTWLAGLGLLGFSGITQIGDLWFPVIGASPGGAVIDAPEGEEGIIPF